MKASDIKTDGTEYAYAERDGQYRRRVKIIEPAVVSGHWRSRGPTPHTKDQPGWLIEFLDDSRDGYIYKGKGARITATSRQIRSTWADHEGDS